MSTELSSGASASTSPETGGETAPASQATDIVPIRRALLSVSDKTGLVELGQALVEHGAELLSTGGSAKALREAGLPVREVSDHSGFPEILDGRVKTLVPQIHGGILGRRDLPEHLEQMEQHAIAPIDLVCVNLYPFERTVAAGADWDECIENIDIGGPALIRAAAKNHDHVCVLTDPGQYASLIEALRALGGTTRSERRAWAGAAYARTSAYDAAIASWFGRERGDLFPLRLHFGGIRAGKLRYGENPHQEGAFYLDGSNRPGVATARQVQGKAVSYNNINDTDAAFEAVAEFAQPAVVIVKHANPCGVATAPDLETAWDRALRCDPVSAFGGIVALNRTLDEATAARIAQIFTEVIIAPDATPEAQAVLSAKKNLRLLLTGGTPDPYAPALTVRSVAGGFLVQNRDNGRMTDLKVVTQRAPTDAELSDLAMAFQVAKHVKSNAIVYVKDGATVGIGAGQMSRVDSARIAASKSRDAARAMGLDTPLTQNSVVASDAFFPFADGLEAAIAAGATAVIQPGGSVRDAEVIAAADKAGIAMVFTGIRHFRH
ncbi:bifunctional phosphoribosylaminoimidazolecarboxamide formyltransferase/IMP cyclohydrolase [Rhizosaccharibacter radicis]|uniref:Bifunctional purine biosynthesis protein PurH n=1 Tax=Rhizosaccharibacter radicis TaxID=2782605 RepID=A0ABT1VVP7_9PROT|nr:bifunctional phosphoribosylaminoimidazolecarboxamide formyltransferase/IMP cyclohydrolase [Acetobacteraceae bacterium KSS12]